MFKYATEKVARHLNKELLLLLLLLFIFVILMTPLELLYGENRHQYSTAMALNSLNTFLHFFFNLQ